MKQSTCGAVICQPGGNELKHDIHINLIAPSAKEVAEENEYSVWTLHPEGSFWSHPRIQKGAPDYTVWPQFQSDGNLLWRSGEKLRVIHRRSTDEISDSK